jgi:hypothetical protein
MPERYDSPALSEVERGISVALRNDVEGAPVLIVTNLG